MSVIMTDSNFTLRVHGAISLRVVAHLEPFRIQAFVLQLFTILISIETGCATFARGLRNPKPAQPPGAQPWVLKPLIRRCR